MKEKRYLISDAAKELEVETHVLRYWEEELSLKIPRNEMGHRYYREEEIKRLKCVKDLKERGFQLKMIRKIVSEVRERTKEELEFLIKEAEKERWDPGKEKRTEIR